MSSFGGYEIHVTSQTFPNLESPWTEVELANKIFSFQRDKTTKVFTVNGYIQQDDMEATHAYAKSFSDSLCANPSGTYYDGYGNSWNVYVTTWNVDAAPAGGKYTFSLTCRVVE
jgi:hypothetical protein